MYGINELGVEYVSLRSDFRIGELWGPQAGGGRVLCGGGDEDEMRSKTT